MRILKEQLLWIRPFDSIEQLNLALREFATRFKEHWILGRLDYRTPAQHRRRLLAQAA
jgi:transposase InsO family protein